MPGSFAPDRAEFYQADPHAAFRQLRAEDPLHWYEPGPFWCVTRHSDVLEISRTPRTFSSAHGTHHCAVLGDSSLRCWGANGAGQLGRGTVSNGSTAAQSPLGISSAVQVSAGFAHSCALLANGTATCWGEGSSGQLGNDSLTTPVTTPVGVSDFTVGARATQADGGASHSCAALSNGRLAGAGLDVFAQEPPPPDNPLFKLDNVVLTAHLAGPTFESNTARLRNGFDNVQRVARGEPPLWVVPELAG